MTDPVELKRLLELASRGHKHLCPRQVLGVRFGLKGMALLNLEGFPTLKNLFVICETDGCFIDGVIAVTKSQVGHRNLRVEDHGKVAATFINSQTGQAVRIAPQVDVRERAWQFAPNETRHYFAQLQAYQIMPDEVLMSVREVTLDPPISWILSRPGHRVNCELCREEIINEREVIVDGKCLCLHCARGGYYQWK